MVIGRLRVIADRGREYPIHITGQFRRIASRGALLFSLMRRRGGQDGEAKETESSLVCCLSNRPKNFLPFSPFSCGSLGRATSSFELVA